MKEEDFDGLQVCRKIVFVLEKQKRIFDWQYASKNIIVLEDGAWAIVMLHTEVVCFVDYGNKEFTSLQHLYQIPYKYVTPKTMTISCTLAGLEYCELSIETKVAFKQFVTEKKLKLRAVRTSPLGVLSCELWDEGGISVFKHLHQAAVHSAYPETTLEPCGAHHKIKVSFVMTCSQFYVQLSSDEKQLMDLMANLQEASLGPASLLPWNEGLPCIARYPADGMFYRAQILTIGEAEVLVKYVDYGNEEWIHFADVREPPPEFMSDLRPQAIECCLLGRELIESSEKCDSLLEQLILDECFTMKVARIEGTRHFVELFDENQVNVECLLAEKLHENDLENSPLPHERNGSHDNSNYPSDKNTISDNSIDCRSMCSNDINAEDNCNSSTICEIGSLIGEEQVDVPYENGTMEITVENGEEPNQYSSNSESAQNFTVKLAYFDNPNEFYLVQSCEVQSLDELMKDLQIHVKTLPEIETVDTGMICAIAKRERNVWFRAQVLDINKGITTVRLIDIGKTDVLSESIKIKTLSAGMLSIAPYARRCSLPLMPENGEWSSEACKMFQQFIRKTSPPRAEIVSEDEKTTFVRLYDGEHCINDIFLDKHFGVEMQIERGNDATGFVSHLNSPSDFWIQFEHAVGDLELLEDKLRNAKNFSALADKIPGILCAAVFPDDESWYRARILAHTEEGIEVIFIDYGNLCTCTQFRALPNEMLMLPPLAHKCSLVKPERIMNWSPQATDKFAELSKDGCTIFTVINQAHGEVNLVKLLLDDNDVSTMLQPEVTNDGICH